MLNLLKRRSEHEPTNIDSSTPADPLAPLRAALAMPRVPAELKLATRRMAAARQARDAAREDATTLRAAASGMLAEVSQAEVAEAEEKFEALERAAKVARADRDILREPFQRDFLASIEGGKAAFVETLNDRLADLEDAARIGMALHAAAMFEGLECPTVISRSREIIAGIHAIRRIVNNGHAG